MARRPFRADTRVPGRPCKSTPQPGPDAGNPLRERLRGRKTWPRLRNSGPKHRGSRLKIDLQIGPLRLTSPTTAHSNTMNVWDNGVFQLNDRPAGLTRSVEKIGRISGSTDLNTIRQQS